MNGLNQLTLIGNLGTDPQRQPSASGRTLCTFRLAVQTRPDVDAEWFTVVLFDEVAKAALQHLDKGRQVHITGRVRQREWTDAQGKPRSSVDVVASSVLYLGSAPTRTLGQVKQALDRSK